VPAEYETELSPKKPVVEMSEDSYGVVSPGKPLKDETAHPAQQSDSIEFS
jgi:hypothetical protein